MFEDIIIIIIITNIIIIIIAQHSKHSILYSISIGFVRVGAHKTMRIDYSNENRKGINGVDV